MAEAHSYAEQAAPGAAAARRRRYAAASAPYASPAHGAAHAGLGAARHPLAVALGLVRAARPRQWLKGVLVVAAPAAAGALATADGRTRTRLAVLAFCLASSAGYLLNDVRDAEEDRRHPRKRHRPIAARLVSPRLALRAAAVLVVLAASVAVGLGGAFAAVLAAYVGLTAAYSLALRHVTGADLAAVAGCHLLRAAGGAAAVAVPLSTAFVVVVGAGALLVVAGKRLADLPGGDGPRRPAPAAEPARATLRTYSARGLRLFAAAAALVTVAAYAAWAVLPGPEHALVPAALSALALAAFAWRYVVLLGRGHGGAPEDLVLGDRRLLALAAAWTALFAGAVYG